MKKIFISQPMKNKTDKEILEEREYLINLVKDKYGEVEILDTFFQHAPHDAKPLWFLAKSIEYLSTEMWLYLLKIGKNIEVVE